MWKTIPTLTFTQGVKSSIPIAGYVSAPLLTAISVALNAVALPPGVSFNIVNKSFDYDGVGAAGSTSGSILTAFTV